MIKVIRMVTTHGHNPVSESYKMEQLYAAAGSVFALRSMSRFWPTWRAGQCRSRPLVWSAPLAATMPSGG